MFKGKCNQGNYCGIRNHRKNTICSTVKGPKTKNFLFSTHPIEPNKIKLTANALRKEKESLLGREGIDSAIVELAFQLSLSELESEVLPYEEVPIEESYITIEDGRVDVIVDGSIEDIDNSINEFIFFGKEKDGFGYIPIDSASVDVTDPDDEANELIEYSKDFDSEVIKVPLVSGGVEGFNEWSKRYDMIGVVDSLDFRVYPPNKEGKTVFSGFNRDFF